MEWYQFLKYTDAIFPYIAVNHSWSFRLPLAFVRGCICYKCYREMEHFTIRCGHICYLYALILDITWQVIKKQKKQETTTKRSKMKQADVLPWHKVVRGAFHLGEWCNTFSTVSTDWVVHEDHVHLGLHLSSFFNVSFSQAETERLLKGHEKFIQVRLLGLMQSWKADWGRSSIIIPIKGRDFSVFIFQQAVSLSWHQ